MINYTIAEFLGIFLVGFPVIIFATIIPFWGIRYLFAEFFKDEDEDEDEEDEEDAKFYGERKRRLRL